MRPYGWVLVYSAFAILIAVASQIAQVRDTIAVNLAISMLIFSLRLLCPQNLCPRCACCRRVQNALQVDNVSNHPAQVANTGSGATGSVTRSTNVVEPERSGYMDALKVFLTCAVIVHHAAGAFAGDGLGLSVGVYRSTFKVFAVCFLSLQQAYFMSLFFFISAFFAPASLGRKGTRAFLADKAKRIVLPMQAMFWLLYPSLMAFAGGVIAHTVG